MMSKPYVRIGAVVCVVLGATWLGTTWYGGQQMMKEFPAALAKLGGDQKGIIKIVVTEKEAGFLTSHVSWAAVITRDPCKPYNGVIIDGDSEIHNGLIPSLGFGQIQTHITWPESIRPVLTNIFGMKEPLQITTTVGLSGAMTTKMVSPAATYSSEQGVLDWKGLNGEFVQNGSGHIQTDFEMDGMTFTAKTTGLVMKMGQMNWSGTTDKGASGIGLGKGTFKLTSLEFDKDSKAYGFNNLNASMDSSERNGFFAVNEQLQIAQLLTSGQSIGKVDVALGIGHIDALALRNVIDVMQKEQSVCKSAPDDLKASADQLIQAAQPILAKGFTAKLDHLDITLSDGKAHADANVDVPSLNSAEMHDLKLALLKVDVDGSVSVSQKLLMSLANFAGQAQAKGQPIDPQQSGQMVDAMLAKVLETGFVSKVDDSTGTNYVSILKLRQGKVILNDKPLDLPNPANTAQVNPFSVSQGMGNSQGSNIQSMSEIMSRSRGVNISAQSITNSQGLNSSSMNTQYSNPN